MNPSLTAFRLEGLEGNLALLTFDTPGSRANILSQATQGELEKLLDDLGQRSDLRGLILRSAKPGIFVAGADLKELGAAVRNAELTRKMIRRMLDIIARFEQLPYPTVAAIDGACMGGGTELALGFDYRLAGTSPKCEIGLPEVKLGLVPAWGGTQRMARVIGPALATEMICSGEPAKAERAKQIGLVFDAVPSDKLVEEARRLIAWSIQTGDWKEQRRRKQQPVGLSEEQHSYTFAVARAQVLEKTKGQLPAPLAALDAIAKGCNVPLEDALRAETEVFGKLFDSPVAKSLIGIFFMTQRLQKDPGVADASVQPRPVERVGVIGAGLMGAGIAGAHIRRGIPVMMLDSSPQALQKGVAANVKSLEGRVGIGRMTQQELVQALGRLSTTQTLAALGDCDVVVEAVVENEEVKTSLYKQLQSILKPQTILATNTSTISVTRMSAAWHRPEQFAGMHFFNPVDRMQLVEVIRGAKTNDATVVTLVALAKRIGKTPIVVRDCPGFLVNRILFPYINESLVLLEEGASPRAIDKAAEAFGMPMGPITLNDLVGLDTSLYAGKVVNTAFADRAKPTKVLDELVAAGRLGQKSGAGFYSYAKGSRGADDPFLTALLERLGARPREFSQQELQDRLFLPMVIEASRVLSEGIVREPADVDMGLILGIGFPAFRGGLLRWADSLGMPAILEKLKKYEPLGVRYQPTEQMRTGSFYRE